MARASLRAASSVSIRGISVSPRRTISIALSRPQCKEAGALSPAESRLSFFDVGAKALVGVLRREEPRLELALEGESLVEAHLEPRLHGPLDLADRERGLVGR